MNHDDYLALLGFLSFAGFLTVLGVAANYLRGWKDRELDRMAREAREKKSTPPPVAP
jgi:hypothetical protein